VRQLKLRALLLAAVALAPVLAAAQSLLVTVSTDKPSYTPGEQVVVSGYVLLDGTPVGGALVAIQVSDPSGNPIVSRTRSTDSSGAYSVAFNLPLNAQEGTYTVYASASYQGHTASNSDTFQVTAHPTPTFDRICELFSMDTVVVVGDRAHPSDVIGATLFGWALGHEGVPRPEARLDTNLTAEQEEYWNMIIAGGPAVNEQAVRFVGEFGVQFSFVGNILIVSVEGLTITYDISKKGSEDIAIVILGEHQGRHVLLICGYYWYGTNAAFLYMSDPARWQEHSGEHILLLRWVDQNGNHLPDPEETTVEASK